MLGILAAVLVVLLVIVAATAIWSVRRPFPSYDGQLAVPGLTAAVSVQRDARGVPTITADTPEDLFRAQGYVHAQDRFYEMDFRRHVTSGRLSELYGDSQVETDAVLRTLGWRRIAEEEVGLLDPTARRYYEAYAEGVNAWLAEHAGGELGLAYALLGLQGVDTDPEPWSVADSLAWFKALAWDLISNWEEEAERVVLAETLPPRRVRQIYPDFPYDRMGTVLSEADLVASGIDAKADQVGSQVQPPALAAVSRALDAAEALAPVVGTGDGLGSNSWVVSPERTASGSAMLANDPHLAAAMPSTWTQVHLRCSTVDEQCPFDVQGFSFSGAPGVFVGRTERVAWGLTTTYADTADLVLEQVRGEEYRTEDGYRKIRTRTETIEVAGGDPVTIEVRSTRHGPIISGVLDSAGEVATAGTLALTDGVPLAPGEDAGEADAGERGAEVEVALRWASLTPQPTGDAVFAMNQARGWDDFVAAMESFASPVQNIVYADADGNTGYYVSGDIPIRRGYDGYLPALGWTGTQEWRGTIPFASKPHALNPEEGYLATANETVVPQGYPYLITSEANFAHRGDRIREVLAEQDQVTPDSSVELQMDDWSANAEQLVPVLLAVADAADLDEYVSSGVDLLRGWDYRQPIDSSAAAYFNAVWASLLSLTFRDELPESAWPDGGRRWFEVVRSLLDRPQDRYWDDTRTTDVREGRDDILLAAMLEGRDEMTRLQGKDPAGWQWGQMHALSLTESTLGESGIGPIEWLFNRGPYEAGGGSQIVQANSYDLTDEEAPFATKNVPSMRMVVDFADLDGGRWVNLTGQSGHPFHPNYVDQVDSWQTGQTYPMTWSAEAVAAATTHTQELVPGNR